jgi:hypothetical protein
VQRLKPNRVVSKAYGQRMQQLYSPATSGSATSLKHSTCVVAAPPSAPPSTLSKKNSLSLVLFGSWMVSPRGSAELATLSGVGRTRMHVLTRPLFRREESLRGWFSYKTWEGGRSISSAFGSERVSCIFPFPSPPPLPSSPPEKDEA